MSEQIFPTKGNLINTKKSLQLATLGYELLDRKRNILIREMMQLIDKAKSIRGEIETTYKEAYLALQNANITMGSAKCSSISDFISPDNGISITYRSVMGVEIPEVTLEQSLPKLGYGIERTNAQFDLAYIKFHRAKQLTAVLAEIDNSVYRLANAIKKTQRRANALKNIVIPRFDSVVKFITNSLEEKEREEFSRLKVIKAAKQNAERSQNSAS